ncbi:MAG TPA: hypothetical protein DDW23_05160, partial [Planctomycetes bacterium]|nr:hypothetical protein [Planctomycetota bacterium]
MRLFLLLVALPCLALWGAPLPGGYQTSIATAKAKLAAGDIGKASEAGLEALSYSPYSAEAYTVLFDIASADGNKESMLRWGKWLYWAHRYSGHNKDADAIATRINPIWADWNADETVISDWRAEVDKAVKSAAGGDKQYRVAGHLMGKLMDLDPGDEKLQKSYDKLSEKAGEMLSGGAFLAEKVRRKSTKWIAQMDEKHGDLMENPWNKKTKNYEIVTNLGYEFVETVAIVMEDIHKFYRNIYGYKKRAPRLKLVVGAPRSSFDRFCIDVLGSGLPGGVLGWFYDKKMTVAAYQDDTPRFQVTMEELYSTLFHEASHQFMYLLCEKPTKQDPPTWLNEGTASYFEGCELKADGSIVKNKPALLRVREWAQIESGGGHSLEEVISYPGPGSYPGSMYSYGWALVYFLNNYEDQEGRLIYRQPYLDYLKAYTKKNKHNAFELAKEIFVREVEDPEIPNWDAFENRWRIWTQGIVRESKSGAEFASVLQDRTRTYLERGDFERALIAAEQADDKRPEDRETYRLLAHAYLGNGHSGEAAFWMLRHWEKAWAAEAEEEANTAEHWLTENGAKDLVASYIKPTRRALARIERLMDDAQSDNFPVAAMLFASHANQAFGISHNRLEETIADIARVSGQDLRLWIKAYANDATANKQYSDGTDKI